MGLVLETERLFLRELDTGDLDFLAEMLADPEVMRWFPETLDRAASLQWLERQRQRYRDPGHGYWLALERAGGAPVGQLGVLPADVGNGEEPALGWMLARAYWGRGYATEGARACLAWARARLAPARVISLVRPENLPSLAVARRIGLEEQGLMEFHGYAHVLFEAPAEAAGG